MPVAQERRPVATERNLIAVSCAAFAAPAVVSPPSAAPTLRLEATSTVEVKEDVAWAIVTVEQDGKNSTQTQKQVTSELAAALATAKRVEGLKVSTAGAVTTPVYDNAGGVTGWRSRAELRIESKDAAAVGQVVSDLAPVAHLSGSGFLLSQTARDAAQNALIGSAVGEFRSKADRSATAFGFAHTTLRDVEVRQSGGDMPRPMMAFAARAPKADTGGSAALPMEPGTAQVSVTVSGTVELQN